MGIFKDLLGTLSSTFKLGIGGPLFKNSSGVIEARNTGDSAFAALRASALRVADANGQQVVIQAPDIVADYTLTLPVDDGSPSQVLTTDGSGALSWTTVAGGSDKPVVDTTTLAFGDASPKAMFALPANAVVRKVSVVVDTPFNGTPSLSVGITGTVSKYLGATQVDLTATAKTIFEVFPGEIASGTSENLIATYAAGGATAGSARILVEYVIPS